MDTVAEIGHYLGHLPSFFMFREFLTLNILVTCKDVSRKRSGRCQRVFFSASLAAKGQACDIGFLIRHLRQTFGSEQKIKAVSLYLSLCHCLSSSVSTVTVKQQFLLQKWPKGIKCVMSVAPAVGWPLCHSLPRTFSVIAWKSLNPWRPLSPRKTRRVGYSTQLPH